MIKKIKSITIVGGGTAAWLTAAYLVKNSSPNIKITLVDKENGTPIGVGEATLLNFVPFMEKCGFSEKDYFDQVDATFKGGILFENWNIDGMDIWHPFSYKAFGDDHNTLTSVWSKHQHLSFLEYGCCNYSVSAKYKKINVGRLEHYARHIDCGKLVSFIKNKIINKLFFIDSEVLEVKRKDDQSIEKLILKNNQEIISDLYIDCTGFKKILGNSKEDKNFLCDRLFCDTAVAGHVPYKNRKKELHPYTACDAVEHGWIWKIPVRKRIGSGLVFNRSITDPETAKDFFVNYWDKRVKKDSLKIIDWTPYYCNNFWDKNVVSIGLSGGFIEPLESTGLEFMRYGIFNLSKVIYKSHYTDHDICQYNLNMRHYYEQSVDFINMHYIGSNKKGKFWDFVREKNNTFSEEMKYYIEELQNNNKYGPNGGNEIFSASNWVVWLIQLGYPVIETNVNISKEESLQLLNQHYLEESEHIENSKDSDLFADQYVNLMIT